MARPEKADVILKRLTSRMGIDTRLEMEKAVVLWREVVGAKVARRAKAEAVRGGILFVRVANSTWLQELSLLKEEIIKKLNALLEGDIVKDIVFRVGMATKETTDGREGETAG
jgi:predicted nucleic acid-binding Zn ribbon protein